MALTAKRVKRVFSRMLAERARQRIASRTDSRTLRAALRVERTRAKWFVGVPHYWAVYYHDGRGPARPRGRWLIWFPNPADDPRHHGLYNRRASTLRSLRDLGWSWQDVVEAVRSGRAVMAKVSPRSGGSVRGRPFFVRGLTNFFRGSGRAERVALFRSLVKKEYPELYQHRTRRIQLHV